MYPKDLTAVLGDSSYITNVMRQLLEKILTPNLLHGAESFLRS